MLDQNEILKYEVAVMHTEALAAQTNLPEYRSTYYIFPSSTKPFLFIYAEVYTKYCMTGITCDIWKIYCKTCIRRDRRKSGHFIKLRCMTFLILFRTYFILSGSCLNKEL
jgi:hypothetical protein